MNNGPGVAQLLIKCWRQVATAVITFPSRTSQLLLETTKHQFEDESRDNNGKLLRKINTANCVWRVVKQNAAVAPPHLEFDNDNEVFICGFL